MEPVARAVSCGRSQVHSSDSRKGAPFAGWARPSPLPTPSRERVPLWQCQTASGVGLRGAAGTRGQQQACPCVPTPSRRTNRRSVTGALARLHALSLQQLAQQPAAGRRRGLIARCVGAFGQSASGFQAGEARHARPCLV